MKERSVKIRIPEFIYKKFKIICSERDISIPKMNAELIRHFIEIDETNKQIMIKVERIKKGE